LSPWISCLVFIFAGLLSIGWVVTESPGRTPRNIDEKTIKVIVLNFDPVLRSKNGARLSKFMKWGDPHAMTRNIVRDLRDVSQGFANYEIVEFTDIDSFPAKRDGFRYDEQSYLAMWDDRSKAHQPDAMSYSSVFQHFRLVDRIQQEGIQEVWIWGAPYFGSDEYAMKLPGDQIFYATDNPWFYRPYDIPDCGRTVWVMGWNYERGEAEALHSYGHRCEGILSLTVARGIWDLKKTPNNIWNHFTKQASEYPEDAQVGTVHGGPNAESGYDYAQQNTVRSAADDWFNYPHLTGAKRSVNCESWGGPDYHRNYMKWWLRHLPHAPGTTDGFYNNWWQYIANYDEAVRILPPPEGKLQTAVNAAR
jgi:hypothetical protein